MAIHSNNDTPAQDPSTPPSFNPTPKATAPQAPVQQEAAWSFGGPRMTGPIAYSQGSDSLLKLREKIAEQFKDSKTNGLDVNVLALDNQQISGIYYSSVVLCMRMTNAQMDGVAFYTMLLTSTRDMPNSKTETIMGKTYEIKVVPGEVFDNVYVDRVVKVVSDAYPSLKLFNVGGTTVPADFNTEDPAAIHRLIYNASAAVYSELRQRQPGFQDINLGNAKNDNNLQVNIVFGRETIENSTSEPMRSDVDVSFVTAQATNNPNESLNNQARRSDRFGKVVGFIDPVWSPVQVQQSAWGVYDPQMAMMMSQKYAARFVMTHLESTQVPTLPAYLLLLLTTLPVGMNQTWYHAFYNQNRFADKKGQIDLTDVGALNIEANLPSAKHPSGNATGFGDRVDTRAKDFTPALFGTYMRRIFRDGLMFALDVPLCGPQTWYLDVFKAACDGKRDAVEAIFGAADYLTNGGFGQQFNSGNSPRAIFADQGSIVHLGYYEDSEGRKRDIRDIDHLAVLNAYGETDMNIVRKWSDSFLLVNMPIQQRLSDRWNIIQAITKNRAVLTGTAQRVTFTDHFLQSLNQAAAGAGMSVKTNTPMSSLMENVERGVAAYVNQALVPASMGGNTFHQMGSTFAPGQTAYGTRQYTRYS